MRAHTGVIPTMQMPPPKYLCRTPLSLSSALLRQLTDSRHTDTNVHGQETEIDSGVTGMGVCVKSGKLNLEETRCRLNTPTDTHAATHPPPGFEDLFPPPSAHVCDGDSWQNEAFDTDVGNTYTDALGHSNRVAEGKFNSGTGILNTGVGNSVCVCARTHGGACVRIPPFPEPYRNEGEGNRAQLLAHTNTHMEIFGGTNRDSTRDLYAPKRVSALFEPTISRSVCLPSHRLVGQPHIHTHNPTMLIDEKNTRELLVTPNAHTAPLSRLVFLS